MSAFKNPFDPEVALARGCNCGTHSSQAEHDAADSLAQRAGILEDLDARIQRATERATAATTDAARSAARTSLDNLTKARAAIAKKIDELKAAGTYHPQP